MKRKIKFRGIAYNSTGFVYGSLVKNGGGCVIIEHRQQPEIHVTDSIWRIDSPAFQVIPSTISQFTGLKDKNGVEIYEGDILDFHLIGLGRSNATVLFKDGCFFLDVQRQAGHFPLYELPRRKDIEVEVIGNIHESATELKEE